MRRWLLDRGGLICLLTLVLYLWLAPSYIVDGDNAEFVTLGHLGGVAHPSGYPLYVLWLRAMSWLPTNPAHAAALATALLAAVQMFVLHAAARAWGARPGAASIAIAIYASAPMALRLHTEAEVFALNGLVVATILWLAAPGCTVTGWRRVAALGLAAGCGLSNHMSAILVAPIGLWGAVAGVRQARGAMVRAAALGVAGLVIGLMPYLDLLIAPSSNASWGAIHGLGDVVNHFLRRDYGTFQLMPGSAGVPASASLIELARSVGRAWWWIPAALGLITVGARIAKGPARLAWGCLAASIVLAGPVFALLMNIEPVGVRLFIAQRFHLLPTALLVIPVAIAFDELGTWIAARDVMRTPSASALGLLAVVVLATGTGASLGRLGRVHSPAVDHVARNMLGSMPQGAVIISGGDYLTEGIAYMQEVEGLRRDVLFINMFQGLPWYRARLSARAGFELFAPGAGAEWDRVGLAILAHDRPLFVDNYIAGVLDDHPRYHSGLLTRVLPAGAPVPPLAQLVTDNQALYEAFDLQYRFPNSDDDVAADVHMFYAQPWQLMVKSLEQAGQPTDDARAMAVFLAPR